MAVAVADREEEDATTDNEEIARLVRMIGLVNKIGKQCRKQSDCIEWQIEWIGLMELKLAQ
ncbi:MAG: hypothetical protein ACREOZ_00425 [Gloeomargaritales cyanobacterium]